MIGAHAYIGKLIGNYRVHAEISNNGLSCVFRGERNAPPKRLVALKLRYALHLSPQKQVQFLQEVHLLTMLKHPHLLPILDSGIDEQSPYLVTDYAPKGSLRDRIEAQSGSPLPVQETLTILTQVGLALQYAHRFHLTHGNLKPENILFTAQGDVLLSDFTISTLVEAAGSAFTNNIRTASYLAPEQLQGVTSEASDQYALGCMAYELLTGQVPFPAVDSSALGPRHAQPPTLLNMLLPARMEEAVLKALATPQEARHATVKDFLTAFGPASLFQPRMLPVPVTPRPTLPVLSSSAFPAQPTSSISPAQIGKHQQMDRGDAPGNAEARQKSDLVEMAKSIDEEDTAALPPVKEAFLPHNMSREQASPPVGVPLNSQVGAGTHNHTGVAETRLPVPSRSIGSHHSSSRSSRFLWVTMVILSLVVVATIISFSSFSFLSVFSPKTDVQVTPQTPTRIPPAGPSSGPSPAPSPIPSATPSSTALPTPTPTRQPSPTTSPLPTPSPSPIPGLTVTPGQFKAQTDCTFRGHWYTCAAMLTLPPGAQGSASWSASSSGLNQVTFSPSGGVLSPGQQQQVSISVHSSCPATGSLMFSDERNTVTVTWSC